MDSASGFPLPQASIQLVDGTVYETSNAGEFEFCMPDSPMVQVSRFGYIPQNATVSPGSVTIELVAIRKLYNKFLNQI